LCDTAIVFLKLRRRRTVFPKRLRFFLEEFS